MAGNDRSNTVAGTDRGTTAGNDRGTLTAQDRWASTANDRYSQRMAGSGDAAGADGQQRYRAARADRN
jgi:hypothetical protein